MTKKSNSKRSGVMNAGTTVSRQDMQSSGAGSTPLVKSRPTSATSATTHPQNLTFQPTPNSPQIAPNAALGKIIQMFSARLVALGLLEWRRWELADGRTGWGLFFDAQKWMVDPLTQELTPLGE